MWGGGGVGLVTEENQECDHPIVIALLIRLSERVHFGVESDRHGRD